MNIATIRARLEQLAAQVAELLQAIDNLPAPTPELPFELVNGMPPAFEGAKPLWEAADRERWPGPPENGDTPFSKWDYLPGLRQLGVGAPEQPPPRFHIPDNPAKFEADVRWLGHSPKGQEWIAHDENAALLNNSQLGRRYSAMFTTGVDGFPRGYYVARKHPNDPSQGYVRVPWVA